MKKKEKKVRKAAKLWVPEEQLRAIRDEAVKTVVQRLESMEPTLQKLMALIEKKLAYLEHRPIKRRAKVHVSDFLQEAEGLTVGKLRQQLSLCDYGTPVILVADHSVGVIKNLVLTEAYPDTTDAEGNWRHCFKIKGVFK